MLEDPNKTEPLTESKYAFAGLLTVICLFILPLPTMILLVVVGITAPAVWIVRKLLQRGFGCFCIAVSGGLMVISALLFADRLPYFGSTFMLSAFGVGLIYGIYKWATRPWKAVKVEKTLEPEPPPPPSVEELLAEAEQRYMGKLAWLGKAGLVDEELKSAREEARQRYLREIDGLL